jgi:membrane-associated protease RseP (regulator of RpoE activity)
MPAYVGVLLFALVVFVVIVAHEAGHFFAARAFGIKVEEFFVGFGPRLWSVRRGETEYGLKAIPAGGYVRIAGMNPFQVPTPEELPRTFGAKPPWQRAIVLLAGSFTHFVLALLFLTVFFAAIGIPEYAPRVAGVETTLEGDPSPAAAAGLRPGDEFLEFDGRPVQSYEEFVEYTRVHAGRELRLVVDRDGKRVSIRATPVLSRVDGRLVGRLGIILTNGSVIDRDRANPLVAVGRALETTRRMVSLSVRSMGEIFSPSGLARIGRQLFGGEARVIDRDPAGIVGAARLSGQAVERGFFDVLFFLFAGFNVFVGILNLLPLPPLDGGHLAVVGIEKLTGKRLDPRRLLPITALVAGFLMLFMASLLYLDIARPLENPFR